MNTRETGRHPYWHGQEVIDQALATDKPAAAAAAFHRAISLMPAAIAEAEADYDSIPEDIRRHHVLLGADYEEALSSQDLYPFTGRDAFAFAAARGDHGSLRILDSICGTYSEEPEPCSADYLRIVQTVHFMVAANDVTDIKDVRKVFSSIDRVRLHSVWRAMRDAKILVVESQGQRVFFRRDVPAPTPSGPTPIAFRKGMSSVESVVLEWPRHLKGLSRDRPTEYGDSFDDWPLAATEEVLVPRESRRSRKSQAASVGDKTWLQGVTVNKRADSSRYFATTVLNPDGSFGRTVELPLGRVRSNPQGDCGIYIDWDFVFRVYTPDAEQVLALSLTATPEVRETVRRFDDRELKATSAIRSVHASLKAERLAVSVINKVFVYSFDGDVVAAFQLDDEDTSRVEFPRISSSRPDWAYFVQLAVDGRGLYIGAYSGLLLHLSFDGELIDSWVLPWSPRFLWESGESISGGSETFFFRAQRGSTNVECHFVDTEGASQLVGSNVIFDTRTGSGFFDLHAFVGRKVQLSKPRTAVYLARGELVMETATSRTSPEVRRAS